MKSTTLTSGSSIIELYLKITLLKHKKFDSTSKLTLSLTFTEKNHISMDFIANKYELLHLLRILCMKINVMMFQENFFYKIYSNFDLLLCSKNPWTNRLQNLAISCSEEVSPLKIKF